LSPTFRSFETLENSEAQEVPGPGSGKEEKEGGKEEKEGVDIQTFYN
jgi:hypothetical protein